MIIDVMSYKISVNSYVLGPCVECGMGFEWGELFTGYCNSCNSPIHVECSDHLSWGDIVFCKKCVRCKYPVFMEEVK